MRTIEVKQLNYDLTAVAGLALVGDYLKTVEPVLKRVDKALPVRAGVANSDIVRSYVGLLVQGKSDFDATRNYRLDKFYKQSLGILPEPSGELLLERRALRYVTSLAQLADLPLHPANSKLTALVLANPSHVATAAAAMSGALPLRTASGQAWRHGLQAAARDAHRG